MNTSNDYPPLPPGAQPLFHQVAGHVYGKSKRKLGLLELRDEVLKPVEATPIGIREVDFYEQMLKTENKNSYEAISLLCPFIPLYFGLSTYKNVRYLRLENICRKYKNPCVIDLKIGRQTWDPCASAADIIRKRKKYPPSEILGFQIVGFQRYHMDQNGIKQVVHHEKRCLRRLSANELIHPLALFFSNNEQDEHISINCILLKSLLDRLYLLYKAMQTQRAYLFYATSLLIVYEANFKATNRIFDCQQSKRIFSDQGNTCELF